MTLDDITPIVLTWNEEPNIDRCLRQLLWASRVVVVDSESRDETQEIARSFKNVDLVVRPFDDHTTQWNYGLAQIETAWVLSLDADYLLGADWTNEVRNLASDRSIHAYYSRFRYAIFDKQLTGSLYPPRAVLFRRQTCQYVSDGHTQLLSVNGATAMLDSPIVHDDRKSLTHWFGAQIHYARKEADKLTSTPHERLGFKDRLRSYIVIAPLATMFYCLILKRLLFDGRAGIYYTTQRVLAELLLSLELLDRKLRPGLIAEERHDHAQAVRGPDTYE